MITWRRLASGVIAPQPRPLHDVPLDERAWRRWHPRRPRPVELAVTRTQLNQSNNTTNTNAFDTGTITPGASSLVVLMVRSHWTTAGATTLTVTNNTGLTIGSWSQIAVSRFSTIASPTDGVYLWGSLSGSTPGSGTVHIVTSITVSGLIWEVIELDGVDLTGGTVASTVQQTGSGASNTAGTTWTDTFGSAVATGNAVVAVGGNANKSAPGGTWNQSFTQDVNVGSGESTAYNLGTGHILSGFTGTSHTVTTTAASATWGICGAEFKASAAAGGAAGEQPIVVVRQAVTRSAYY